MGLNSMLSMPVSFVTSAQKRGWNAVNFRVSPNSVYLIQDEWRVRFYRGEEKKFWTLERSGENGWIEIHTVFHPGSSRLDWVLVTFKKIMVHFERMKFTTTDKLGEDSNQHESPPKIDYSSMKVSELRELLDSKGLENSGKKGELVDRLNKHDFGE